MEWFDWDVMSNSLVTSTVVRLQIVWLLKLFNMPFLLESSYFYIVWIDTVKYTQQL